MLLADRGHPHQAFMGNTSGEARQLLIFNASHTEGRLSLQLVQKHAPLSSILDSVYHTASRYRERANTTQSQPSNRIRVDPVGSITPGEKLRGQKRHVVHGIESLGPWECSGENLHSAERLNTRVLKMKTGTGNLWAYSSQKKSEARAVCVTDIFPIT